MQTEVLTAVLALAGTLLGSLFGVIASAKLTTFRISELEKKVDRLYSVAERLAVVERELKTAFNYIDELKHGK
ncbi:MAG: hypothetical protein IJU78_04885 [Clostridia bacterium]|nr:hypothetical protein [Clostridia bacterium]